MGRAVTEALGDMSLVACIQDAWGWIGLVPDQIVGENDFGNLIIKDKAGRYWRLTPEDLTCVILAENRFALEQLQQDQTFLHDWYMKSLIEEARRTVGLLRPGYKYCLKVPAPLGGEFGGSNLAQIPVRELITFSGDVARQIKDLPDGAKVEFKIVN